MVDQRVHGPAQEQPPIPPLGVGIGEERAAQGPLGQEGLDPLAVEEQVVTPHSIISAAAPETKGAAMLVPVKVS